MEIRAYIEDYLASAQKILGDMLDYGVNTCGMDAKDVFQMFVTSEAGRQFEDGNPTYVAGMTGCELLKEVLAEKGMKIPEEAEAMYLDKSPEYWAGWALAFYQWHTGKMFSRIQRAVPIDNVIDMYDIFHEIDISKFVETLDEKISEFYVDTNLKRMRKAADLSQNELAELSGVSLRQIQLFEQRQRDINKMQAINLWRLAKALGCRVEDLLEV